MKEIIIEHEIYEEPINNERHATYNVIVRENGKPNITIEYENKGQAEFAKNVLSEYLRLTEGQKKAYRVHQDGLRCNDYQIKGWHNDTFPTKREAEVYAFAWSTGVPKSEAEENAPTMEIGSESIHGKHTGRPMVMKILEVISL
jgi:hypothetical protein